MSDRDSAYGANQIKDRSLTQLELDLTNTPTDGQIIKINMPNGDFTAIDANAGSGNVTSALNITDNRVIRGDGGAKGVQESTVSISDNGEMTNASQPSFRVKNLSAQLNITADGNAQTIILDTEVFDVGSNFASNVFTAPVTGKYHLSFVVQLNNLDTSATQYRITIFTSNQDYNHQIDPQQFAADVAIWVFTMSIITDMDLGDTANLRFTQDSGTAQTDIPSTNAHFSGFLVA